MKHKKVAIVGSRNFPRLDLVRDRVSLLEPGTTVLSGGAPGVDELAEDRARRRGLQVISVPAKWRVNGVYNPRAGTDRNAEIIGPSDEVFAFLAKCLKCKSKARCPRKGWSHGTSDSIEKALRAQKHLTITAVLDDGRVVVRTSGPRGGGDGIDDFGNSGL